MSGGPENGCVGRVYDLDGAVRVAPDDGRMRPLSGALDVKLQHMVFCTQSVDEWWS